MHRNSLWSSKDLLNVGKCFEGLKLHYTLTALAMGQFLGTFPQKVYYPDTTWVSTTLKWRAEANTNTNTLPVWGVLRDGDGRGREENGQREKGKEGWGKSQEGREGGKCGTRGERREKKNIFCPSGVTGIFCWVWFHVNNVMIYYFLFCFVSIFTWFVAVFVPRHVHRRCLSTNIKLSLAI